MKTVYCDNQYCESPAFTKVKVSVKRTGDSTRNFCAPCAEAYMIGVQHGTFRTLTEVRSAARVDTQKKSDHKRRMRN